MGTPSRQLLEKSRFRRGRSGLDPDRTSDLGGEKAMVPQALEQLPCRISRHSGPETKEGRTTLDSRSETPSDPPLNRRKPPGASNRRRISIFKSENPQCSKWVRSPPGRVAGVRTASCPAGSLPIWHVGHHLDSIHEPSPATTLADAGSVPLRPRSLNPRYPRPRKRQIHGCHRHHRPLRLRQ